MRLSPGRAISLALLLGSMAAGKSAAQQTDAISREISIFNDLSNPVAIQDAVSREVSVFNDLSPPVQFTEAISREITVFNDLTNPIAFNDAVSREISALNAFGCPTDSHGNLSGNLTDDGIVTPEDIAPFVDVLVGVTENPYLKAAADINCDGKNDALDIQPFVILALGL